MEKNGYYESMASGFLVFAVWYGLCHMEISNKNLISHEAWIWFVASNFFTFAINFLDKMLALCSCWCQVPEAVLHLLSLIGGSPATALSMMVFKHKSSNKSYQVVFNACCSMHLWLFFMAVCVRHFD